MSGPEAFAFLPPYLRPLMKHREMGVAWPVSVIPALIEATRSAGLINLGGDLQVAGPEGVWESPNQGLWVLPTELSGEAGEASEIAARIALSKFQGLCCNSVLLDEALAGCPYLAGQSRDAALDRLDFSWNVKSA